MEHQSITYEDKRVDDVKKSDCSPEQIDGGMRYTVVCPACSGNFNLDDFEGFRAGIFFARSSEPIVEIPVICDCGLMHEGRPTSDGFHGCGAVWQLVP